MTEDLRPPYRIQFDNARDPYTARNALGVTPEAIGAQSLDAELWTTWSPTISSSGGTITSSTVAVARYQRIGKTVIAAFDFTITNAGTGTGFLRITLPVQVSASGAGAVAAYIFNTGAAAVAGIPASGASLSLVKYDGSIIVTTGNRLQGTAIYEGV